jgi:hypothetical protein
MVDVSAMGGMADDGLAAAETDVEAARAWRRDEGLAAAAGERVLEPLRR